MPGPLATDTTTTTIASTTPSTTADTPTTTAPAVTTTQAATASGGTSVTLPPAVPATVISADEIAAIEAELDEIDQLLADLDAAFAQD